MPSARINEADIACPDGISILQALHRAGIEVPALCADERLKPLGGCRLCVVEVKGCARPVPACLTPLADGMEIRTHTRELEDHRRTLLALLARDYPLECVAEAPDKEFHRWLKAYGVLEGAISSGAALDGAPHCGAQELCDDSHPYIHVDMAKCITCLRCVRICAEVQGQFVWQIWERGDRTTIRPDSGTTLAQSSCVSCGACVDTCPTGALEDKSILTTGRATEWTKTTCSYCGTGCEMQAGTREGKLVSVRPEEAAPVNHGHLCVKGRYAFDFVYAADRITRPMLRSRGGEWQAVSWATAIEHVAEQFRQALDRYGPTGVGVLGSARATNEENYLAQKFARVVLGTNNVDCCARVCHAPTAAAMKAILGAGAATNSFNDIEHAATILVAGSNATENHPIVGARIKQAALNGARLIVVDPRRIELAKYAECHLPVRPGANVLLFNALAATIVEEGLVDSEFIGERVSEFEAFTRFVRAFAPEAVAERCGVAADLIRTAARIYATAKPAMCIHGLGMTEHVQGTEGVMTLVNLALLTGNIGRAGAGINPMRGQNNVQGAAQMGCEPNNLTGVPLGANRERFEAEWNVRLPRERGLNLLRMLDAAQAGTFKALWAIGYDILLTNANVSATQDALRQLECVVVQDMFLNETAREFGTVFLPAASSFEKDGTFMNAERRIQRVRKVIEPLGESMSDREIICRLAEAMGAASGFAFQTAEEVWNEVRRLWPAVAGISYSRIDQAGLQWPCTADDHPGTQVLHGESFAVGRRAALRCIDYRPTEEVVSSEFPFRLITGRTLYQFNAGTMTRRTLNLEMHPDDLLEIAPEDASRLNLGDGAAATVRSRYGEATLIAHINADMRPGELFCTFHNPNVMVNRVTSSHRDSLVDTPEYKLTAVQVTPMASSVESAAIAP